MSKLLVSIAVSLLLLMKSSKCSKLNMCNCYATTSKCKLLGIVLPCMRNIAATFTAKLLITLSKKTYFGADSGSACLWPHSETNQNCLHLRKSTNGGKILSHKDFCIAEDGLLFGDLTIHRSNYYLITIDF